MSLKFNWGGAKNGPFSTMFVGTFPAFDFAVFSLCSISLFKGGPPKEKILHLQNHKSTCNNKIRSKNDRQDQLSFYPTSVARWFQFEWLNIYYFDWENAMMRPVTFQKALGAWLSGLFTDEVKHCLIWCNRPDCINKWLKLFIWEWLV